MKNKTCGECRYLGNAKKTGLCEKLQVCLYPDDRPTCKMFEPRVVTNGDKIRQGGDYALAHFKSEHRCDVCAYAAPIDTAPACRRPEGKSCFDGMLAWLNAPAERDGKDETR